MRRIARYGQISRPGLACAPAMNRMLAVSRAGACQGKREVQGRTAFTLTELLVVIAVIGILAAL
jgi:prepilin-type N-terminal cleavage/methylation domain-containing protein